MKMTKLLLSSLFENTVDVGKLFRRRNLHSRVDFPHVQHSLGCHVLSMLAKALIYQYDDHIESFYHRYREMFRSVCRVEINMELTFDLHASTRSMDIKKCF